MTDKHTQSPVSTNKRQEEIVLATIPADGADGDPLEALREILLGHYRSHAQELEAELTQAQTIIAALDERINDRAALMDTIAPIIAQSIHSSIRDSRDEMVEALHPIMADAIQSSIHASRDAMVEALYPIMGRLVQRAVTEAMRDLARSIDEQMRTAFSFRTVSRRIMARAGGLSEAEIAIRDSLPFVVDEIFLIHRESGLLLRYLEFDPSKMAEISISIDHVVAAEVPAADLTDTAVGIEANPSIVDDGSANNDSDLISGMLTAIRDFAADTLGEEGEGQLDEVQFGEKSILIEAAPHVYMAVVVRGVEPRGFRNEIRERVFAVENRYLYALRSYDGDPAPFAATNEQLYSLAAIGQPFTDLQRARQTETGQIWKLFAEKPWLIILLGLIILLLGWGFFQSIF